MIFDLSHLAMGPSVRVGLIKSHAGKVPGSAIAWAGFNPLTAEGPTAEPQEHIWVEFGKSTEQAEQRLKQEMEKHFGEIAWA